MLNTINVVFQPNCDSNNKLRDGKINSESGYPICVRLSAVARWLKNCLMVLALDVNVNTPCPNKRINNNDINNKRIFDDNAKQRSAALKDMELIISIRWIDNLSISRPNRGSISEAISVELE